MMRLVLLAIVTAALAACSNQRPSHADAEAACEHQVELGFWEGFAKSVEKQGLKPDDPKAKQIGQDGLEQNKKTDEWKQAVAKCTDTFERLASKDQIKCVMAATTPAASQACLGSDH